MTSKNEDTKGQTNESISEDARAKNIENHRQAAAHHIEAAKHHLEAAKQRQAGDHDIAAHNTILAYGHSAIAGDFLSDDAKHHAQALKQTRYQ